MTQPNHQSYLVLEKGGKVQWFAQILTIPPSVNGYSLAGLSLYLESPINRGASRSSFGEQKKLDRYSEGLRYEGELFMSVAKDVYSKRAPFPRLHHHNAQKHFCQEKIAQAWQGILFNQSHDILPGKSIPEVFTEAEVKWQQAREIGETILQESLEAIASHLLLPPPPHREAKPPQNNLI
jgi:alpha-mannosidase